VKATLLSGRPIRRVDVARSWARARADYAALTAERDTLKAECAELRREHERLLDLLRLARALVRSAKTNVGAEIERVTRERDIAQAERTQRDPGQPLQ
jgi:hypothetical protein